MDLIENPAPLPLPSDEFDSVVAAFAALVRYQLTSVAEDNPSVAAALGQCDEEAA